jgi:hypothetical protein
MGKKRLLVFRVGFESQLEQTLQPSIGTSVQVEEVGRERVKSGNGSVFSSMIMTCINPHRLGLACALESALAIKIQRTAIRHKHVLMKSLVTSHEAAHQLGADASSLILWQNQQVRIIHHEMTV